MSSQKHTVRLFRRPFFWTLGLICIPGLFGGAVVFAEYGPFEALIGLLGRAWEYVAPVLTVFFYWAVLAWAASPFALYKMGPRTASGIVAGFLVSIVVGAFYIAVVVTFADS